MGGAVYAEMQSVAPCLFVVTDYSAEISFIGNFAKKLIGQHNMYGTSFRDRRCHEMTNYRPIPQEKHFCVIGSNYTKHINISFYPDLSSETLSPVSSAPMHMYLCDMNGRPQCANLSHIAIHELSWCVLPARQT